MRNIKWVGSAEVYGESKACWFARRKRRTNLPSGLNASLKKIWAVKKWADVKYRPFSCELLVSFPTRVSSQTSAHPRHATRLHASGPCIGRVTVSPSRYEARQLLRPESRERTCWAPNCVVRPHR